MNQLCIYIDEACIQLYNATKNIRIAWHVGERIKRQTAWLLTKQVNSEADPGSGGERGAARALNTSKFTA
jgi:hypothetical protein